jgi:hypothetical protein
MADLQVTAALAGSAAAAGAAPTLPSPLVRDENRPWRWVVHTGSLDLYAEREPVYFPGRQRHGLSPEDRVILINCGGALHRAQVALAAGGFESSVSLLPDDDPSHVATLTPTQAIEVTDEARERLAASAGAEAPATPAGAPARPGRRPTTVAMKALIGAAEAEGVHVRLLDRTEVLRLASSTPVTRSVRGRVSQDDGGVYGVLYGESDTADAWLRAGEALSALRLEATRRGLSVSPSSSVVELRGGRAVVRTLLPRNSTPYLAVRVDSSPG